MPQDVSVSPESDEQLASRRCRAFGLAAIAAELNLQANAFEPETAKAIESGAAALFLAGYGPTLTGSPASSRFKERERESERRSATCARKAETIAAPEKRKPRPGCNAGELAVAASPS